MKCQNMYIGVPYLLIKDHNTIIERNMHLYDAIRLSKSRIFTFCNKSFIQKDSKENCIVTTVYIHPKLKKKS